MCNIRISNRKMYIIFEYNKVLIYKYIQMGRLRVHNMQYKCLYVNIYIYIYEKGYGEWIIYIYIFKTKWMGHICIPSCSALSMWEGYELCLHINIYIYMKRDREWIIYIWCALFVNGANFFTVESLCAYCT
jgi:hypothetical protein